MKHLLLIPALLICSLCKAQQIKNTTKKDATITLKPGAEIKFTDTLSESQVIQISNLLAFGEQAAGSSDKISTNQYNQYHAQVVKIDSVLRSMWVKWHPVKVTDKKKTN